MWSVEILKFISVIVKRKPHGHMLCPSYERTWKILVHNNTLYSIISKSIVKLPIIKLKDKDNNLII